MRTVSLVVSVLLVGIAAWLVVVNFSAVETRYECRGTGGINAGGRGKIYLKREDYRWWVGLWSESKGSFWIEAPGVSVAYYGDVSEAGSMLQMRGASERQFGQFSTLSHHIDVYVPGYGTFSGNCKKIE